MNQAIKLTREEGLVKELEIYFEPLDAQKIFLRKAVFRFDKSFINDWPNIKKGNRKIDLANSDPKTKAAFELIGQEENINFHIFNFTIKGNSKLEKIKEKINYALSFKEPEKMVIHLNVSRKGSLTNEDGMAIREIIKLKKEDSPIVAVYLNEGIVKQDAIYLQIISINGDFF